MKHLLKLMDLSKEEIYGILNMRRSTIYRTDVWRVKRWG